MGAKASGVSVARTAGSRLVARPSTRRTPSQALSEVRCRAEKQGQRVLFELGGEHRSSGSLQEALPNLLLERTAELPHVAGGRPEESHQRIDAVVAISSCAGEWQ